MPWVKKLKIKKKIQFFLEALTARPWLVGIYLIFFPVIILSAIKHFILEKKLKGNLAFISKIFDLKIIFGGIDCRIVIG